MPTPDIFNFDPDCLIGYDRVLIDRVLIEQPELYLNHLRVAQHITAWADRDEQRHPSTSDDDRYQKGYVEALREIAAKLRQADYVVGGVMLREVS